MRHMSILHVLHSKTSRRQRTAAFLALVVAAVAPLAGCAESMNASEVTGPIITIGIAYDRPGVAMELSGNLTGLDVDVAQYVAHRLGYAKNQISWREASNADRDELLKKGDVNMIVGVHADLDGTTDDVEFSQPYVNSAQDLMVRTSDSDTITELSDLKGKSICTVDGSVAPGVAEAIKKAGATTITTSSYSECVTALLSGTTDAVEGDDLVLAGIVENSGSGMMHLLNTPLTTVGYGIALPAGDAKLRDNVDDALQRMVDDGSWDASMKANINLEGFALNSAIAKS